jgi:uncharacterized protein (DUF305 family)
MNSGTTLAAILAGTLIGGGALAQHHAGPGMNHAQMGGMQVSAANPYPPSEMRMHERMMQATGRDATETWVRKMIEHHRGGIEMSQVVLRDTRDARVRQMATKSMGEQQREIGNLQAWLRQHGRAAQ